METRGATDRRASERTSVRSAPRVGDVGYARQVIAVRFGSGPESQARVLDEVDRLQGRGVLRLLDMLFVAKIEDGTIQRWRKLRR